MRPQVLSFLSLEQTIRLSFTSFWRVCNHCSPPTGRLLIFEGFLSPILNASLSSPFVIRLIVSQVDKTCIT